MLIRVWRLLDHAERRTVVGLTPLVLFTAAFELVGIAAVIPFVTLLASPEAVLELPLLGPWVAASGVDDATTLLRTAGVGLALAVLAMNALAMLTRWRQYRVEAELNCTMATRLLAHYLSQPYAFTLTRNSANISNAVTTQVTRVTNGIGTGLHLLTSSVTVAVLLVFLIALDPIIALTSFLVLGTLYGTVFLISRRYLTRTSRELVMIGSARLKAVVEAVAGFRDLKLAGRERDAVRHFRQPAERQAAIQAAVNAVTGLPRSALEAIAVGGMVVIASLTAGRDGALAATLPVLSAYVFGALRLMPAMQNVFGALVGLRNTVGAVELLEADLAEAREPEDTGTEAPNPLPFVNTISLRSIGYRYPTGNEPALQNIDLEIAKGRTVALVGRTGSGKTTLVNVLLGLFEPTSGYIEVDGTPLCAHDRRAFRQLFGCVPQDIFLLDDTIRRNIAIGVPDEEIDDDAVRRASAQARIDDFIERELPNEYDTVVGERGVRLSGGQRQRIGIARALYHQPSVLVFDEATSALDIHTERKVFEALEAISKSRTLVMVAHRLETAERADLVVILDNGRVSASGPAAEVLRAFREASMPM